MKKIKPILINLALSVSSAIRYGRKSNSAEPFVPVDGHYLDAVYANVSRPLFNIQAEIVCNKLGFNYSKQGWSVITAFLEEYRQTGTGVEEIGGQPSIIHDFYARYRPETLADVYSLHDSESSYFQRRVPQAFLFPWCLQKYVVKAYARGWHFSGPANESETLERVGNILGVYTSIQKKGYHPEKFSGHAVDAHPRGFFLKKGDEYRFVILGGNHRAAVLASLGYETIPVTFRSDYPRVIDRASVDQWPQVRQGNMTPLEAEKVFLYYFNDGVEVARRLGLWHR